MMDQDQSQDAWARRNSQQTLPSISALSGPVRPSPPLRDARDSGNWSMASKHSSVSGGIQLPPLEKLETLHPNLAPHNEHTPSFNGSLNTSPHSHHSQTHSHSPTGASYSGPNHSSASLHHPSPPHYFNQHPQESNGHNHQSPSASRRSSFDSRLNGLHLNSPLNSTPAASQISLANTLNRERSLHNTSPGHDSVTSPVNGSGAGSTYSGMSGPVPSMVTSPTPGRIAPPIIGTSRFPYPHPNAPSPTKGFPYAFPDPDIVGPSAKDAAQDGRRTSTSSTASTNPSVYSHASSMLHPAHALQNHASSPNGSLTHFNSTDNEYLHHHHFLQDRRKQLPLGGDANSSTPYSRTPELRVSHKLAERKRRKEMKDLFDELRDALPAERGGKSSKWEVLTKAIEHINQLKVHHDAMQKELDSLRAERENYRSSVGHGHEMDRVRHSLSQNHHHQSQQHSRMQGIERY
ncbi:hypothetical protein DFH27DRAFT_606363 [Peziza echinospora]|nr:hypothetical protein DFH27DRAFT_606363 [Peziza echinospora]